MKRSKRKALPANRLGKLLEKLERVKASIRAKVEHPFHVVKNLFKHKKTKQSFDPKLGVGAKAVRFAEEEGLICRAVGGDNIGLCPPLVIDGAEINAMFDMVARALDKTEAWARKEGHLG